MKMAPPKSGTLRFIFIAVVFMLLADHFVFGGKRSYIEEARQVHVAEIQPEKGPPVRVEPEDGKEYFEAQPPVIMEEPEIKKAEDTPVPAEKEAEAKPEIVVTPEKKVVELPKPSVHGAPKIAIIIDDLGMDVRRSKQVVDLPAPITLAILPYAQKAKEIAAAGKAKGHTLIIHTPMEAMDGKLNIGPGGLKVSMSDAELDAAFGVMMKSFDGYEGINNHMGSRLTQDKEAMDRIMSVLAAKGLFFVDSKTIQSSVAAQEAASSGVAYAERDVFLDHEETPAFVGTALAHAEKLALRRGYAIAIGHPKDVTINGLKAWIPTLQAKGIELVSVKDLLVRPKVTEPVIVKDEPAPVIDMFPEEQDMVVVPAGPVTNVVSDPASTLPEIQLHPLPEQSPAP